MNILVVTPWYPSWLNPIEGVFVERIAQALSSYVHLVVFAFLTDYSPSGLTLPPNDTWGKEVSRFLWREDKENFSVYRTITKASGIPKWGYILKLRWAVKCLNRVAKQEGPWDIFHAHTYNGGVLGGIIKPFWKTPLVITEHWSGFITGEAKGWERIKALFAYQNADIVCPVSEYLKENILRWGITARRWEVIGNIVDWEITEKAHTSPSQGEPWRLLFVSNLTPLKGLKPLLNALAELKKENLLFTLTLVGDGELRNEVLGLIRSLNLYDTVIMTGNLPPDKVKEMMMSHHLLVHPSEVETFSVVVAEAVGMGLPVVASDLPAIRNLVSDSEGILVPPGDYTALAQAIKTAIAQYHNFSLQPSIKIRNSYSSDIIATRYLNLYQELLNRKKTLFLN